MVLVFEVTILEHLGPFQGYTLEVERYLHTILDHPKFMARDEVERDPRYKQLIPYVVLRFRDSVFSYVRGKQSGEARLVAKRSIGLGGHIEYYKDYNLFSYNSSRGFYYEAVKREISEEVNLDAPYVEHIVALINDSSNDVGKVHFGIVHIWDLAEPKVRKRESQIAQAGFVTIKSLIAAWDELETWSQITLKILEDPRVPRYTTGGE